MISPWKTTLDGVAYEGVWSKYAVLRLLPGAVKPDGYGTDLGVISRYPMGSLGGYINTQRKAGIPWEWCTLEEYWASQGQVVVPSQPVVDVAGLQAKLVDARRLIVLAKCNLDEMDYLRNSVGEGIQEAIDRINA